jgi:hypothetical protein
MDMDKKYKWSTSKGEQYILLAHKELFFLGG